MQYKTGGYSKVPNDVLEGKLTTSSCGAIPEQQNDGVLSKAETLQERGALVVVSGRNGGEVKRRRDKGRNIYIYVYFFDKTKKN